MGLVLALLLAGSVAGVLAGLLGVGGGVILVPMLEAALAASGVDASIRMHMAVATSLATIVPTSLSSARAHHAKQAIDFTMIRYWSPFIILGAIVGIVISTYVTGQVLAAVFAVVGLFAAIKLMLPVHERKIASDVPRGMVGAPLPIAIGGVSTLMGIGGGLISVPAMTLFGKPIHVAVGTSALFGFFIAAPSAIGYVISGWGNSLLPIGSVGYVNLIGFALVVPATILFAPVGARLAHRLSQPTLRLVFGLFLLAAVVRMGLQAAA